MNRPRERTRTSLVRLLRRLAAGVLALALFIAALPVGLWLAGQVPAGRVALGRLASRLLSDLGPDRVVIARISHIGLDGFDIGQVHLDIVGVGSIAIEQLRVRAPLLAALRSLVRSSAVVRARADVVAAERVDLDLRPGPRPAGTRTSGPPPRLDLHLSELRIARVRVRGALSSDNGGAAGEPGAMLDVEVERVRGRGFVDDRAASARLSARALVRAPVPFPIEADFDVEATLPRATSDPERSAHAVVHARAEGVRADIDANLAGETLELRAKVPRAPAPAVARLLPSLHLTRSIALDLYARGTLDRVQVDGRLSVGRGRLRLRGEARPKGPYRARFAVTASHLDARTFDPRAPRSDISLRGGGAADFDPSMRDPLAGLSGAAWLATRPCTLAGVRLPAMRARARAAHGDLFSEVRGEEPGARVAVEASRSATGEVHANADVWLAELAQVHHYLPRPNLGGRLALHARAHLARDRQVDGVGHLDGYRLALPGVDVGAVSVDAAAHGPLASPVLSLDGHAVSLFGEGWSLERASVRVRGTFDELDVQAHASEVPDGAMNALATLAWRDGAFILEGPSIQGRRGGERVWAGARRIVIGRDRTEVSGLVVRGLGAPLEVDGALRSTGAQVRVRSDGIDLARIARVIRYDGRLEGLVAVDIEGRLGARSEAKASLRASDVAWEGLSRMDGTVEARLDHAGRLSASASGGSDGLGRVEIALRADATGPLLRARSWTDAAGRLSVSARDLHAEALCRELSCPPSLSSLVRTLHIVAAGNVVLRRGPAGGSARESLAIEAHLDDARGRLLDLEARTRLNVARVMAERALSPGSPVEARITLAERSLADLPPALHPVRLAGTLGGSLTASGSLAAPSVEAHLVASRLRDLESPWHGGFDVVCDAGYDGEDARLNVVATAEGRTVARAQGHLALSWEWLPWERRSRACGRSEWKGEATVALRALPLAAIGPLAARGITGSLTGDLGVSGLHDRPLVRAEWTVDGLGAASAASPAKGSVHVDEKSATLDLTLGSPGNRARVTASAGLSWRDGLVPGLAPSVPASVALEAEHFSLARLRPWIGEAAARVDGTIDGRMKVSGHPDRDAGDLVVEGGLELSNGRALLAALGRQLSNVRARLTADGRGAIRLEEVSGDAGEGAFRASGALDLVRGALTRARAEVHVTRSRAIPVTVQGVSYGTAWGDVVADAQVNGRTLEGTVRASTLRLDMNPQATATLEPLDDNPRVTVLQPLGPEETRAASAATSSGPPWVFGWLGVDSAAVGFELGDNVGVKREDMRVELSTFPPPQNPRLSVGAVGSHGARPVRIEGGVRILGGTVPVAGRTFQIERGSVRFGGREVDDPSLDITASTDASGGTRVLVHVGGTVQKMSVALTSTPPKPESELFALLAFGQAEPGASAPNSVGGGPAPGATGAGTGQGATGAAAGIGAGVLSSSLNRLLQQSVVPIRASVSGGARTAASAAVDVSERVRVQYTRAFGSAQYGQERTDANEFGLDWRFRPQWLLHTQVGDRGSTSFELLWQRWY